MSKAVERLVRSFKPEHYKLSLNVDISSKRYSGKVVIKGVKVGRPSSRITLHQKDLKVKNYSLVRHHKGENTSVELDRHNAHDGYDELRIHSKEILYPGNYTVTVEFEANITEPSHGIYPCNYTENGHKKTLIATQFESHHAREAFPCIDEPEAKAVFELELTYPSGLTALSNTPIVSQADNKGLQTAEFEPTPLMSTYLLAFAIGDIAYKQTNLGDVTIRAYSTPSGVNNTVFALETAKRCLEFYDDYFGTAYPLKKLDMIALPDMGAVTLAMENWGLVTFRESALLYDENTSTIETKMLIAQVINHELAHQWFGNLVTMRWWNDLWLNESFAHIMEFTATDKLFPEWDIWQYFNEYELDMALKRDALTSIAPIRTTINHPDEIGPNFDRAIAYAKGAVVLNMLRHFIGEDSFKSALKHYFSEHAYKNTEAQDLWACMDKASTKQDVKQFMSSWINKPGYPILSVDWQINSKTVTINQDRFLANQDHRSGSTIWHIPLDTQPAQPTKLMSAKQIKIDLKEPAQNLIFNKNVSGYFLINYTNLNHIALINEAMVSKDLSPSYRSYYVQSLIMLDKAGVIDTKRLLDTIHLLADETEPTVWSAITASLEYLCYLLSSSSQLANAFQLYSQGLINKIFNSITWKNEPQESIGSKKLRIYIVSTAVSINHPKALSYAIEIYNNPSGFKELSPELRKYVYQAVILSGEQDAFDALLTKHNDANTTAEQKEEIVYGLVRTSDLSQAKTLLTMLNSKHIKHQDLMTSWLKDLFINPVTRELTWEWLTNNWQWVDKIFGDDHGFERFAYYPAQAFQTETEHAIYSKFFSAHKSSLVISKSIELGEEMIIDKINWHKRSDHLVKDWLNQHLN